MNPVLESEVTLMYIRGGIAKSGRPYLQVSNGRAEFFLNIPKKFDGITETTFDDLAEGDEITVTVSQLVGSDRVVLVSL